MTRYIMKTSAGYVGTDTEEDITEYFTEDDYKKYSGETSTKDGPKFFDDLLEQAIQQQNFEWCIEKVED